MAFEKALKDAQAGDFIVLMYGTPKISNGIHYPVTS